MRTHALRGVLAVLVVAAVEMHAHAQVCTQSAPGVAQISTNGVRVAISVTSAHVPKVNGASCGFAAAAIDIVGASGDDTVTLRAIPPAIPVTITLVPGGIDRVTIILDDADDHLRCDAYRIDRDDDGTFDVLVTGPIALDRLTVDGRGGNDTLDCRLAGFPLVVKGGVGNDLLRGGPDDDVLDPGPGDDVASGFEGDDRFLAGTAPDGADAYDGGPGTDTMSYARRTTPVIVGRAGAEDSLAADIETIVGGHGGDILDVTTYGTAPHTLRGGDGDDLLRGGRGVDRLYGEAGNDRLEAGVGAKDLVIDGGDGDDSFGKHLDGYAETIRCGPGVDRYVGNYEDTFSSCEDSVGAAQGTDTIAVGGQHTCAVLDGGSVKCWGANDFGQLGLGDTAPRGLTSGSMGGALPTVALGTGRSAIGLVAGYNFTCALLDDHSVKCWGENAFGQLGQGHTQNIGDEPGEMGDALAPIALGAYHGAKMIAAGTNHVCALLENGTIRCWGAGGFLGVGDTETRGDQPGEMGDALLTVKLANAGVTAHWIAAGSGATCAVLDAGGTGNPDTGDRVKCWGAGGHGILGQGNGQWIGDAPGEMGDALPTVDLGADRRVQMVEVGGSHACAILDDDTAKCWGSNADGALGLGLGAGVVNLGDEPGEMGDALPTVDIDAAQGVLSLSLGTNDTCARLDDGRAKCWGTNPSGQLGQGHTGTIGDEPGEMGAALAPIDLGTGRTARTIRVLHHHACATLEDHALKCWGYGGSGQLGLGDGGLTRGDAPGEMGDSLPTVNLGGSVRLAPADAHGGSTPGGEVAGSSQAEAAEVGVEAEDAIDDALAPDPLAAAPLAADELADASGCAASRGGGAALAGALLVVLGLRRLAAGARRSRARSSWCSDCAASRGGGAALAGALLVVLGLRRRRAATR